MKIKCTACGAKLHKDEEICPKCGYQLYASLYEDIANEVEAELDKITQDDIDCIARDEKRRASLQGSLRDKLTREEFERIYLQTHKKPRNIILSRSAAVAVAVYESNLTKAYNDYLRNMGYDI